MTMGVHDIVGSAGVVMVLGLYALLQLGRLDPNQRRYGLLNAIGASLILLSLSHDFNWSAFLMELSWVAISLMGVVRAWPKRFEAPAPGLSNDHEGLKRLHSQCHGLASRCGSSAPGNSKTCIGCELTIRP